MVKTKSVAFLVLLVAFLAVAANATTISDSVSKFTGSLEVEPTSATTALTVDQNYDSTGLEIDSSGSGYGLYVKGTGTGRKIFTRTTGAGTPLYVEQAVGATAYGITGITAYGVGNYDGIFWNYHGTDYAIGLDVRNESTGGLLIEGIEDNGAYPSRGGYIKGDFDVGALELEINDGDGYGLFADMNDDGIAINIDTEAINKPAIGFVGTDNGACNTSYYGFYESSGDIYWCKNGAGTKLN